MSVFGATLPNPTLVNDVHVKYKAVMYRDLQEVLNQLQLNVTIFLNKEILLVYNRNL